MRATALRRLRMKAAMATAVFLVLATTAGADHIQPGKAQKAKIPLVNAFYPCDTPNTATQSGDAIDSCAPAAPFDLCAFSSTGTGVFTAQPTGNPALGTQDVKLGAVAKGLNPLCENDHLCIWLSFRATSDDCPQGSCTSGDIQEIDFPVGSEACCTVTGGMCKARTTLRGGLPGLFSSGNNSGIELLGCGLKRDPPGIAPPAVSCGILLK